MIFTETKLAGAFVIELEKHEDDRGFFARTFCVDEFAKHGLVTDVVQCNLAYTKLKGTIRGLHYQVKPYEEVKLTRCVKGSALDVIIDMRRDSNTFGQYFSVELNEDNKLSMYVPEGFAHGYMSLTDDIVFMYQVSRRYAPGSEHGIRWNDPDVNIQWPHMEKYIVSEKDSSAPLWRDIIG